MTVPSVSKTDLNSAIANSKLPLLVEFWAPWCSPCRLLEPIVNEIANEHKATLKILKLNIDENPTASLRFEVLSVPTLILFVQGEAMVRITGAKPKHSLLNDIETYL